MKLLPKVLTIALALTAVDAAALTSDKDKNIRVQADSAVVDDKQGLSTYTGNVVVDQGTLHITADKVQIISHNNEVVKVVASTRDQSNELAHYQQMPDNSDHLVQADARQITWLVKQRQLELEGSAKLSQTHDTSFSGETIHYDANRGTVNAESGEKAQVETVF
ncbi:MAG TPA: lipopolysaccharide transport periplasmic protein LptA, partial [Pseudomonadales bacterium]|nr:lipopolysaccharide transport periplasmic protein LptA [Pseudomonadales bacterium]